MSKSDTFNCRATADGGMSFTEYNRERFKAWLKENAGIYLQIKPLRDESSKMRRFLEGAVVPLCTFYQENMNYKSPDDNETMREFLKVEFNGELKVIAGKTHRIAKSTKGGDVLPDFIERVIAWMGEQGYQTELLNPEDYKVWRDTIFPYSDIDNYIDYLLSINRLRYPHSVIDH